MTHPLLPALRETFATLTAAALRHTTGGQLNEADLKGLYTRAARMHGITPEDAKRWLTDGDA